MAGKPIIHSNFPDLKQEMQHYNAGWSTNNNVNDLENCIKSINHQQVAEKTKFARKNRFINQWKYEAEKLNKLYE